MYAARRSAPLTLIAASLLTGCGGTEPTPPPGVVTGRIHVTSATTGSDLDPDGYTVMVGGTSQGQIASLGGELMLADREPGVVRIGLGGLAANCAVAGENPRDVTVVADATVEAAFAVTCTALPPGTGTVRITTASSGSELDPDGFTVQVGSAPAQPIGVNATLDVPGLAPGTAVVALGGVADNCFVGGDNPRAVAIASGGTANVAFAVTCAPRSGAIAVRVFAEGRAIDADGFTLRIDGGVEQPLPPSGTTTLTDIPVGQPILTFGGVAENCTLTTPATQQVWVNGGQTATVDLRVLCPGTLTGRIVFVGPGPSLNSMATDGTERERITAVARAYTEPMVSPDGRTIAYSGWDQNSLPRVVALRYDGKEFRHLSPAGICAQQPSWSPDGSAIAFMDCGDETVWVMNADGSGAHRVTPDGMSGDWEPSWSPDGTKLVFRNGQALGTMNRDGSARTLMPLPLRPVSPNWSPSEATILFTAGGDLYTVRPDGSNLLRLTTDRGASRGLWSPDGSRIVYARGGSVEHGVHTMGADGTGDLHLSAGSGTDDWDPAWGY
ncbi:MAG TPA: hypothetical protein VFS40_15340 [Gemmatimonadales bacterium]|nr:hypothetical protein [Gemmatimonadales bacterium]